MKQLKKSRGGKRPGAGMPAGYKTAKTIDKELHREALRAIVIAEMEPMIRVQIAHAKGIDHFFLRNEKTKQFERVTEPAIIQNALNSGDKDAYYWIFTKDPSVQAFTDLMNRALDKPIEPIEHTGPGGGPIPFTWQDPPRAKSS